jgi:energy-coupling factor transporter ATP-binding protein EcfA2
MSELLLKISGLNKSFFGVQVLRDVGFELNRGAVLGLVGENGSGKSTTMNILGGVLTRDSGRVELAGEDVAPSSSRDALALGIAFIHQELSLGADPDSAGKAGIRVQAITFSVFCICSVCAAIGALISVSQVGAASATFGYQEEFPVIAAAVLGGTSLFGGRGGVFGSIFGAVLVQTTSNGLVMLNANPYLYPLVNSVIIFIAAWVDGQRRLMTERIEQRKIRIEA